METVLQGRCLCGAVRYECVGDTENASYCHCEDCKRATGGPYTVGVLVKVADLHVISGGVRRYTTIADSGRQITREFCPNCGSPLFTRAEECPDLVFLKAGCLDEPELIKPSHHTWAEYAVPWAYPDENLPSYPEGSDNAKSRRL